MVSLENKVIGAVGILAILLFYLLGTVTEVTTGVRIAVVIFVGVIVPQLINEWVSSP